MEEREEAVFTQEQQDQALRDFNQYEVWSKMFTERELAEISYCNMYYDGFNHGTADHNLRIIVAKFADLLTQSSPDREYKLSPPFDNSK